MKKKLFKLKSISSNKKIVKFDIIAFVTSFARLNAFKYHQVSAVKKNLKSPTSELLFFFSLNHPPQKMIIS